MAGTDFVTEAQMNAAIAALAAQMNTLRNQVAFINYHGATAGTARNNKFAVNLWVGTVSPTNKIAGDLVLTLT